MESQEHEGLSHKSLDTFGQWSKFSGIADLQNVAKTTGVGCQSDVDVLGQARSSVQEHRLSTDEHKGEFLRTKLTCDTRNEPGEIRRTEGVHSERAQ